MNKNHLLAVDFFKQQDLKYAFDSLTQILNREMILGYYSYLIENKIPFSCALIDVDNFKLINDTYGHLVGDEVLYKFADAVLESVGETGYIGRYGGDEFMLLIPNVVEYDDVWKIFHQINSDLGEVEYKKISSLEVTATIGISRFPVDGNNEEEILTTCDRALYRGKSKGRNCFIIYLESKHANINVNDISSFSFNSTEMISRMFSILDKNRDVRQNIQDMLKFLTSYLSIDNMCIQTKDRICTECINMSVKNRTFPFIPENEYDVCMNSAGVFYINARKHLIPIGANSLFDRLKSNELYSIAVVRIQSNERVYGCLMAKSIEKHVWQTNEVDLFIIAARTIGMLLEYNNLTFDDLYIED